MASPVEETHNEILCWRPLSIGELVLAKSESVVISSSQQANVWRFRRSDRLELRVTIRVQVDYDIDIDV